MKYSRVLVFYCLIFFTMRAAASFSLGSSYTVDASWTNGYEITVTLHNNTANPTSSWTASFSLGAGQTMSNPWNAVVSINGPTVTISNPTWGGGEIIPANGSATFGFIVNNPQQTTPGLSGLQATANGAGRIPKLESYWESWNADPIANIINMDFNIVDVAFVTFSVTDSVTDTFAITGLNCDQATLTSFVTQTHNAGKKVKISVGGATYPLAGFLTSDAAAQGMANAIANFVIANNLDGVDFDIEDYYYAPNWGTLQIALIQHTRTALGNNAIISYTPKTPTSSSFAYDVVSQGVCSIVDAINIMAYDYGVGTGYTYQADVGSMVDMGIPISVIGIGLMPGADDLGVITTLPDIVTAADFIIANGLVGMMQWDLNRDYENLTGLGPSAATTTAWNVFNP